MLNIDEGNESIDDYIFRTFNIFNPDPVYVFLLPDNLNRTIILRRSNFSEITFPNMTALQALQKILKTSKFRQFLDNDNNRKPKDLLTDDRQFIAKYQQFISDESELYEAESLKVIEENIRTERNFFKFMDRLNDGDSDSVVIEAEKPPREPIRNVKRKKRPTDYQSLIKDIHAKDHIGNYELTTDQQREAILRPHSTKVTWEDFGLPGWTGNINMRHENPDENG